MAYERTDDYFDLHVPGAGHYLAAGFWHHNTGKTLACCFKLHALLWKYAGSQAVLLRREYKTLIPTVYQTLRKVLGPQSPVKPHGGEHPQWLDFPNGSRLWLAGLDDPGKALSSDRDFVYCFVGGTRVEMPSPVRRAYRRVYSGPLVTVRTAGGNQLTGTPNHPILTDAGWIALGELVVGNNLICRGRQEQVAPGNPDVQHGPTTMAEVVRSLAELGPGRVITQRVAGIDMDFHGDGQDADIDVVTADGLFEDARETPLPKPGGKHLVGRTGLDLEPFVGQRPGFEGSLPLGLAPAPGGNGGEPCDPFGVASSPVVGRFAPGAGAEPALLQLADQVGITAPDRRGNGHEVTFPFEVTPDRVVKVSRIDLVSGTHVYNLQTAHHYYIANNVIVHNCNQAEEISLEDWGILCSRATGRAGNSPYPQVMGDCNPSVPWHWIRARAREGRLVVLESRHEDNPTLFDRGEWTPLGRSTLETLDALPGVLRDRLRHGRWVAAEGTVYELDARIHVLSGEDLLKLGIAECVK